MKNKSRRIHFDLKGVSLLRGLRATVICLSLFRELEAPIMRCIHESAKPHGCKIPEE